MESPAPQALEQWLLDAPAAEPPPGQTSNFDSTENVSVYAIPVIALTLSLTATALAIRIYTRHFIIRSVSWDDYVAIVGWAFFVGFCVACEYCALYGGGRHQWDTRTRDLFSLLYYSILVQALYAPTTLFIKLSILFQYIRAFAPIGARHMGIFVTIHVVMWSNVILYTVNMFIGIFPCNPREMAWNKFITTGQCLDIQATYLSSAALNVVSDVVILLLPQYSIWRMSLSRRQKLGVSAVFAVGLLACVTSICRLVWTIFLFRSGDVTWNMVTTGLWAAAEIAICLICSCLPVFPKFFQTVLPKLSRKSRPGPSQMSIIGLSQVSLARYPSSKRTSTTTDATDTFASSVGDLSMRNYSYGPFQQLAYKYKQFAG